MSGIMQHCFLYVHRCFGKTDAFIIGLVPMVTKMDVSLWKVLCLFGSDSGRVDFI